MPIDNKWSQEHADDFAARYADSWGENLALRTYSSRLIGAEESLVLHGGGNTSVKDVVADTSGRAVPAISSTAP